MFCALLQVLKDQLAFRLCGGLSIMTKLLQLLHDENIVHLYPKYVSYLYPNLWIPPALKLGFLFVSKRWIRLKSKLSILSVSKFWISSIFYLYPTYALYLHPMYVFQLCSQFRFYNAVEVKESFIFSCHWALYHSYTLNLIDNRNLAIGSSDETWICVCSYLPVFFVWFCLQNVFKCLPSDETGL